MLKKIVKKKRKWANEKLQDVSLGTLHICIKKGFNKLKTIHGYFK